MREPRKQTQGERPIYTSLAEIYDTLMADVDYEAWGDYLDDIIQLHAPGTETILELGCGTGSISLSLDELQCYRITGTDLSPDMIRIARRKASERGSRVNFRVMNFLRPDLNDRYDLALLIFDGLNYLLDRNELSKMFRGVTRMLRPGGHFLFDFTTPRHSRQSIRYLDGAEGKSGGMTYRQSSRYDRKSQIHINEFLIESDRPDHPILREKHMQRPYTEPEIREVAEKDGFRVLAAYDSFTLEPGHEHSLRITMVCQCPNPA